MSTKLLFLADLGRFKAYRLEESRQFSHPRLELIEDSETNVTRHLSQELSDQAGRFRRGVPEGAAATTDGEHHNLDWERRRRALKMMAARIRELLNQEKPEDFYFAADPQINRVILDQLDERIRSRMQKNIAANLTKLDPEQIIQHFSEGQTRTAASLA